MALYWNWQKDFGELIYKAPKGKKRFKERLYKGNCLAVIAQYEEPGPTNDLKEPGYVCYGAFWADIEHLRRCLGLKGKGQNIYHNLTKIRLNTYYLDKEMESIAMAFAKAKVTVELYYKEPKKREKK